MGGLETPVSAESFVHPSVLRQIDIRRLLASQVWGKVVLMAAFALAGCVGRAGGQKPVAGNEPATSSQTSVPVVTSREDYCQLVLYYTKISRLVDKSVGQSPETVRRLLDEVEKGVRRARASAPAELVNDWDEVILPFEVFRGLVEAAGYDLLKVDARVLDQYDTQQYRDAKARLRSYHIEKCGLDESTPPAEPVAPAGATAMGADAKLTG